MKDPCQRVAIPYTSLGTGVKNQNICILLEFKYDTIFPKRIDEVKVVLYPSIPPIPEVSTANMSVLQECGEPLLALSTLSPKIAVYSAYYHQGYDGALPEIYLRENAAKRLIAAAEKLPASFHLVALDGWRSTQVQASLYEQFRQSLLRQGWQEGAALKAELGKFVALPTTDRQKPSPHLSGGAIDLTIAGPDGWLDMGTDFDDFSDMADTRYFEEISEPTEQQRAIRDNRRLLYHLMIEGGFVNYPKEWWHYEYGTRSWAVRTQQEPRYGGIQTIHEISKS